MFHRASEMSTTGSESFIWLGLVAAGKSAYCWMLLKPVVQELWSTGDSFAFDGSNTGPASMGITTTGAESFMECVLETDRPPGSKASTEASASCRGEPSAAQVGAAAEFDLMDAEEEKPARREPPTATSIMPATATATRTNCVHDLPGCARLDCGVCTD